MHIQETPEIAVELAEMLVALGIDPGTGWKKRLRREAKRLPDLDSCGAVTGAARWFELLSPTVRRRARMLSLLKRNLCYDTRRRAVAR
jgi:hypothetical protein